MSGCPPHRERHPTAGQRNTASAKRDFRLYCLYVVAALVVLLIALPSKEITMRQTLCDGYLIILR